MDFSNRIDKMIKELSDLEHHLAIQGGSLAKTFKDNRIELHRQWLAQMAAQGTPVSKYSVGSWCPLTLFSRYHNGTLEIYWQLVHRKKVTKTVIYKHLRKGNGDKYDLRSLLSHAHSFERELVIQFEEEASIQRTRWAYLKKATAQLQLLKRSNDAESDLLRQLGCDSRDEVGYTWPKVARMDDSRY